MSLISEALKKADNNRTETLGESPVPEPASRSLWVYRAVLLGSIALVLAGLAVVTHRPSRMLPPTAGAASFVIPETPPPSALDQGLQLLRKSQGLSGIISGGEGERLALIDNQVVQKGDRVRGMTVAQVNPDSVELQEDNGGKTKTLKLEN